MAAFSQNNGQPIREDNLVVKLPKSSKLNIPERYEQFREAIEKIVAYEAKHSKTFPYRMARLTIRQWKVEPGERQDSIEGGWHFDRRGMDASEVPFEDDVYVISDRDGTLAQAKPLHDVFRQLDGTDQPIEGVSVQAQPGQIVRMTNNTRHRSVPSQQGGWRTFLRLTFESPDRKFLESLPKAERQALGLNF